MTAPRPRPFRKPWLLASLVALAGAGAFWAHHHHDTVRAWLRSLSGGTKVHPVEGGPEITSPDFARMGEGFLVWESNRTGPWRIWTRRLDGSGLRQLTPEVPGREHCCAAISPDGRQVAYLSLGGARYGADDEEGELHLIGADGKGDRVAAPRAQTASRGHRATLWHDAAHLQYIDGEGNALLLDLATGKNEKLAAPSSEGHGWLIERTRGHATTGLPTFSLYDAARRAVTERAAYGGCEPTFSDDGRWGVWMSGAGGPLRALDLASRTAKTLFEKNDPRLGRQAYLYFPKLSNGSALLAFGASPNEHDHEKGNYDVFLAEVDPRTLEVLGTPLQYTSARTPDRYPDVYVEPLPLGRTFGEAPYRATLAPRDPAEAARLDAATRWDFGDGSPATTGVRGEHLYERPGSLTVTARPRSGEPLHGRVTILPPQPPKALDAELRQGRGIVVTFDEPVAAAPGGLKADLASGRKIAQSSFAPDGRSLLLTLAEEQTAGDRLRLAGIVDRAQRPNALVPVDLEIPPPSWPADRKNLILLWATADQPNLAPDPAQGSDRTYALAPHARARLDHDQAMLLVGEGAFRAEEEAGKSLVELAKRSNELTLELTLTPAEAAPASSGVIVSFGSARDELLALEQRGDSLVWRLRRGQFSESGDAAALRFGKLQAGKAVHVVVGYSPGHSVVYLDGAKVLDSDTWQGDFFDWKPGILSIGSNADGKRGWRGRAEGLALFDRLLSDEEVAEDARRWAAVRARRPAVPVTRVMATLERCSRVPSLDEISPYRQALAVCAYKVDRVIAGPAPGPSLRVVRWVILDGATLPIPKKPSEMLHLEPFSANPQLESLYLSNDLGAASAPLFFDPFSG